eukprot:Hpha_TRINITY_DN15495_c2_g1::TRINITY_DN15495_c2_g1_i19::g.173891::m.173891
MALMCFARVSRREELIALELPLDGCIGDLRREVAAAAGISESSFDIFLGEESLRDDTTLADSGITSEAVVDARTRDEIEERHKRLRKDDGVIADNGRELTYHCHDGWYGVRAESGSSCGVMIVDYEVQGEAVMLGLALEDIRDTGFYDGCCTGASWLVYTGDGECCEPYSSEEAQGWHSSELRKASHFPDEGEEAEDEETEGEGEEAEDEEAAKAANSEPRIGSRETTAPHKWRAVIDFEAGFVQFQSGVFEGPKLGGVTKGKTVYPYIMLLNECTIKAALH